MATFLLLNGADIDATIDQQEQIILALAWADEPAGIRGMVESARQDRC